MKTLNILTIILLVILFSCSSQVMPNGDNANFGIFEMLKTKEIPVHVIESIEAKNVRLENDKQSSVIGYISKSDTAVLQLDFSKENIKLVKTFYTVDSAKEYYAIAAIKPKAVMNIYDVKKTYENGNNVDIHFNKSGAKKWAKMTKNNVSNTVAFVIDNQIYSMPRVRGQIKIGMAWISGLENESISKEVSELLNAMILE